MSSVNLLDFFAADPADRPEKHYPFTEEDYEKDYSFLSPGLLAEVKALDQRNKERALRASFGLEDIERLLRENKELRAERDTLRAERNALKATIVDIREMIEQWRAVRQALRQ